MSDQPKPTLSDMFRSVRRQNRLSWTPSTSLDPADRAADRDALNKAIRRASGRGEPEPGEEPQSDPWKTISTPENGS